MTSKASPLRAGLAGCTQPVPESLSVAEHMAPSMSQGGRVYSGTNVYWLL